MSTFLDLRQSILHPTPNMIGSTPNAGADVLLSSIDSELGKLFEDRNAMLKDGGQITFTGTQLQFTQNLVLELTQRTTGALPTSFSLGSASVTLANGDTWIATLNRTANTVVTSVVLSGVALAAANFTNQDIFVIAARRDSADGTQTVYFRSGMSLTAGSTARLGAAGSGSGTGSINYITNPNAEVNTSGWNLYSDNQTVTITNASPAVFTVTSTTGYYVGMPIAFTTSGSLPTGLTSGTTYYISNVLTLTQFRVSATLGGADVNTSSAGSGTHTARPLVPVTASGGTISGLTFARTTSLPLRGTGSFLATQSNSTVVAGQGISTDITIDNEDQAHVMSIQIDFNASSTFAASSGQTGSESDIEIFIKDLTNSILIPVSPKVITANGANNFTFKGIFQTSNNSTSYRLCIHAATTNANATGWAFKFDTVMVGPQVILQGPPVIDWTSFPMTITGTTTSGTKGTVAIDEARWRRVGDSMEISYNFQQTAAGTSGSGQYLFGLPAGYSIDTSKLSVNINGDITCGRALVSSALHMSANNANTDPASVIPYDSTHLALTATPQSGGLLQSVVSFVGSSFFDFTNTNLHYSFNATIPILGWSSTTLMSNDTSTQSVALAVIKTVSQAVTANTTNITFPTTQKDTLGGWNGTDTYTVPVAGDYLVGVQQMSDAGANQDQFLVYINNSVATNGILAQTGSANSAQANGMAIFSGLFPGDTISIRCNQSTTIAGQGKLSIYRLAGPSAIAATDSVNASYYVSANFSASTTIPINYDSKEYDSHGAVTTSPTAWRFTAPISGLYQFSSGNMETVGATTVGINLYKNNVIYRQIGLINNNINTTAIGSLKLKAGDFVDIRPSSSVTITGGTIDGSNSTTIQILRVGNY